VLVLDEPLNGLDPMARAEVTDIFKEMAGEGRFILISSHILHEVDVLADRVALLDCGYVVAEGEVDEVRVEMEARPIQVLVRCERAKQVASALLLQDHLVEVLINDDGGGFLARTRNSGHFYQQLQEIVLRERVQVRKVKVADSDVRAVYQYLIEDEGKAR
jgi:ABC-2 type transport system ATP-binding protein